jgi:hypothetical protein
MEVTTNYGKQFTKPVSKQVTEEVEAPAIDWRKVPDGTIAMIDLDSNMDGSYQGVVGFIFKDNNKKGKIHFLQNDYNSGSCDREQKRNYSSAFSFTIDENGADNSETLNVRFFDSKESLPEGYEIPKPHFYVGDRSIEIRKGKVVVGCQTVTNSQVRALWGEVSRLKSQQK